MNHEDRGPALMDLIVAAGYLAGLTVIAFVLIFGIPMLLLLVFT